METMSARFAASEVQDFPFPHLVVGNVFPDSVYREMEESLPSYFRWFGSFVLNRLREPMFGIRDGNPSTPLLGQFAVAWKRFEPYVSAMDRLTIEKFAPFIDREPMFGQSVFCQRSRNWTSTPHTHDMIQILQSMVYFPLPGSTEDMGTVFYTVDKPEPAFKTVRYANAKEVMTLPYRANTLVSFLNTPTAVHGVVRHGKPRRYIFTGIQHSSGLPAIPL